jgi:hypothetical protein
LHDVRVAVRVDDGDDRDPELVRLGDGDVLLLGVQHEHRLRTPRHVPDAAEVALQLLELTPEDQRLLLRHGVELARRAHALVLSHLADALGDGLEVREHAAQPPLVHVRHAALVGVRSDRVLSLLLRADEQNRAAVGDEVADEGVRRLDASERLLEVDDVDAAALAEDESLHLGVPPAGLVPEMDARLEQLTHGDDRRHDLHVSFLRLAWRHRPRPVGRPQVAARSWICRPSGRVTMVADQHRGRSGVPAARCASRRPARRPVGRHEPRPQDPARQQQLGVEVHVTAAHAEVEARAARADDDALGHALPAPDGDRREIRVARAQSVGMGDGDVQVAADGTGEGHQPAAAGPHRGAGRDGVVDAPVAGAPGARRRPEVVDDRRVDRR